MRNNRDRRRKKQTTQTKISLSLKKMIIIVVSFLVLLFFSTVFALTVSVSENIIARVSVNGVDISNLTIDEDSPYMFHIIIVKVYLQHLYKDI